jgi:23S rRNA pseudouridine955/2504/2580 synthase
MSMRGKSGGKSGTGKTGAGKAGGGAKGQGARAPKGGPKTSRTPMPRGANPKSAGGGGRFRSGGAEGYQGRRREEDEPLRTGPRFPARPGYKVPTRESQARDQERERGDQERRSDDGYSDERPKRARSSSNRPARARPDQDARPARAARPQRDDARREDADAFAPREPRSPRSEPRAPRSTAPSDTPEAPRVTKAEVRAATSAVLATGVQTLVVTEDEAGMRIDRFLQSRFPQVPNSYIQRIARKGELKVDGKKVDPKDRLEPGQSMRVPPLKFDPVEVRPRNVRPGDDTLEFLRSITLYEDADVMVLNKPAGLAVQGGSGTVRHLDGLLDALTDRDGQKPRLVHRLDKDTAGCLLVAKTRMAAAALAKTFRSRSARKVYWALVAGVPRVRQGRVSTYLARDENREADSRVNVVQHGDEGAMHAVTYYAVVDTSATKLAWLSMKPVTGRTHQLRAHAAHMGHPIVGDPKYFNVENWELPGGIQNKLHLLARRIVVPHPRGKGVIDVSAPIPPHMRQSWNLLGLDDSHYDPIIDAPDE